MKKKNQKTILVGAGVALAVLYIYRDKLIYPLLEKLKNKENDNIRFKVIRIIYGSQSGTSEDFAYQLRNEIQIKYLSKSTKKCYVIDPSDVRDLNCFFDKDVDDTVLTVFLVATYGEGSPTKSFEHIYNYVKNRKSPLNTFHYCVLGLGSSNYTYFNRAGRTFYRFINKLQGNSVCPYYELDDSKDNEIQFENWLQTIILPAIQKKLEDNISQEKINLNYYDTNEFFIAKNLIITSSLENVHINLAKKAKWLQRSYLVEIDESIELCQTIDIYKESTKLLQFNLQTARQMPLKLGTGSAQTKDLTCIDQLNFWTRPVNLTYQTGMILSVYIPNSVENINRVFRIFTNNFQLNVNMDDYITIDNIPEDLRDNLNSWFVGQTIRTILTYGCHLSGPIRRHTLRLFSYFINDKKQRKDLQTFISNSALIKTLRKQHLSLCDCLEIFLHSNHCISDNIQNFITALMYLPPPVPRAYSISSSSLTSPRKIEIIVREWQEPVYCYSAKTLRHAWEKGMDYFTNFLKSSSKNHLTFKGFASNYLCSLKTPLNRACHALVQLSESALKFPLDTTPGTIICICNGTGLGPIFGYLLELEAKCINKYKKNPGYTNRSDLDLPESVILCFGCRHPNKDFICREKILSWMYPTKERPVPIITHFWPAFSRYPLSLTSEFNTALQKSVNFCINNNENTTNTVDFSDEKKCQEFFSSLSHLEDKVFGAYVQDVLMEKTELLCTLMENTQNIYYFVCGSKKMGKQVNANFTKLYESHNESTKSAWEECKNTNKYCVDVW